MKYSIKVNEVRNSENVKGIVSVTLGDSFKLNNITIVNDPREQNKVFVSMPSYKDGQGEYKDIFNPVTKEFHDELYDNILKAYHELHDVQAKNSYQVVYNKEDTTMPEFTVRVTPYEKEGNTIRGLASINFGGLAVGNITIHESKEGSLFVNMPSYKTNQNDEHGKPIYKDVCHPVTAKFREKLNNAILQEYVNAKERQRTATKDSVVGKLDKYKDAQKESGTKDAQTKEHNRDDVQR